MSTNEYKHKHQELGSRAELRGQICSQGSLDLDDCICTPTAGFRTWVMSQDAFEQVGIVFYPWCTLLRTMATVATLRIERQFLCAVVRVLFTIRQWSSACIFTSCQTRLWTLPWLWFGVSWCFFVGTLYIVFGAQVVAVVCLAGAFLASFSKAWHMFFCRVAEVSPISWLQTWRRLNERKEMKSHFSLGVLNVLWATFALWLQLTSFRKCLQDTMSRQLFIIFAIVTALAFGLGGTSHMQIFKLQREILGKQMVPAAVLFSQIAHTFFPKYRSIKYCLGCCSKTFSVDQTYLLFDSYLFVILQFSFCYFTVTVCYFTGFCYFTGIISYFTVIAFFSVIFC